MMAREVLWVKDLDETERKIIASARYYANDATYPEIGAHYKKLIAKLADKLDLKEYEEGDHK
jgi:hypothetical protein